VPGVSGLLLRGQARHLPWTRAALDHRGALIRGGHLIAAVRLVRSGDALLAPSITRRLVERYAGQQPAPAEVSADLSALTPRELEVLGLIARGLSNAELAVALTLSEATVKTHVARILAKLQLRDRVQALVLAYETGLVSPGGVR
jgi:DNA-binding NarL/FixJ family response regulator